MAYSIDAFSHLAKQILDLSGSHFNTTTIPSSEILARIPAVLPSILADTVSSRHLRAAYITHRISSIITHRIFTPFLFSIGRRFDHADGLLTNMSHHLRGKSTRKEAIWRQHTLTAAYTTTDAKTRINSAASSVIDEIVNAIKHFAKPDEEERIRYAVRRIVKLAAEAWRFARLERELIEASMPAAEDKHEDDGNGGFWMPQNFEQAAYPVNAVKSVFEAPAEGRKILLRLLPIIRREPVHEGFQLTQQEINDQGCVYSHGLALYSDAPPVFVRCQEVRSAIIVEPPVIDPVATDTSLSLHQDSATSLEECAQEFALPVVSPPPSCPPVVLPRPFNTSSINTTDPGFIQVLDVVPQRSRAETPPSPLFPAIDEIDSLNNRSQYPQTPPTRRCDIGEIESRESSGSGWEDESVQGSAVGHRVRYDGRSAGLKGLYDSSSDGRGIGKMGNVRVTKGSRGGKTRNSSLGRVFVADWSFDGTHDGGGGRDNR
jgi:hypothetical protein